MRTEELQRRLASLGFEAGPFDGIYGEMTETAVFDCMDKYCPPTVVPAGVIPLEWMPAVKMDRVITHWTAGAYTANSTDLQHYHIVIEGDGKLVRGQYSIKDNVDCSDGKYAAHTKSCNTGSIGISLACMAGATESPFNAGAYPLNAVQWRTLAQAVAELCTAYAIPVGRETVLSHAEVQRTLGIAQEGKIDIMWVPGMAKMGDAIIIGDQFRKDISALM